MFKKYKLISLLLALLLVLNTYITVYPDGLAEDSEKPEWIDDTENEEYQQQMRDEVKNIELKQQRIEAEMQQLKEEQLKAHKDTMQIERTDENFIFKLPDEQIKLPLQEEQVQALNSDSSIFDNMNLLYGVSNPQYIENESDRVSMLSGNHEYIYNILSLPGLDGFDFALNLKYSSGLSNSSTSINPHVIANGWILDLPWIGSINLIIGTFSDSAACATKYYKTITLLTGETYLIDEDHNNALVDFNCQPQTSDVVITQNDNNIIVATHVDGTYERFENELIKEIGDRFGNKITFDYNGKICNKITDSLGREIHIEGRGIITNPNTITIKAKQEVDGNMLEKTYAKLNTVDSTWNLGSKGDPKYNTLLGSITDSNNKNITFTYQTRTTYGHVDYGNGVTNRWELLQSVTYPSGRSTSYSYENFNRLFTFAYNSYPTGVTNRGTGIVVIPKIYSISKSNGDFKSYYYAYVGTYDGYVITDYTGCYQVGGDERYGNMTVRSSVFSAEKWDSYEYVGDKLKTHTYNEAYVYEYEYTTYDRVSSKTTYAINGEGGKKLLYTEHWEYNHGDTVKTPTKYTDMYGNETIYCFSEHLIPISITKNYYNRGVLSNIYKSTSELTDSNLRIDTTTEYYDTDNDLQYDKYLTTKYDYTTKNNRKVLDSRKVYAGQTATGTPVYTENYDYNTISPFVSSITKKYETNDPTFELEERESILEYEYYPITNYVKKATTLQSEYTEYEYDNYGRMILETYPDGTFKEMLYDDDNNYVNISYNDQYKTRAYYDGYGRTYKETEFDGSNEILLMTYSYDKRYLDKKIHPDGSYEKYIYDNFDNVTDVIYSTGETNSNGEEIYFGINKNIYDYYNNNVTSITGYHLVNDEIIGNRSITEMDKFGREKYTKVNSDAGEMVYATQYDYMGNISLKSDGKGNETTFEYNVLGQLLSTTNALDQETTYEYDIFGNNTSVTTPGQSTVSYNYNTIGQLLESTDAMGNKQKYYYDNDGRLVKSRDRNGNISTTSFKNLTNYPQTVTTGGITTSYTYDNLGNMRTMTDTEGTTQYDYYYNNRLETITLPDNKNIRYTYDTAGRVTGVRNYRGINTSYQYDKMGRLQSINSSSFLRYNYSRTQTTPAAKTTQAAMFYYTYDNAYNLTAMTTYTAASGNDNFEYQYDLNGNQVKKSFRHRDASQYVTTNYSYDALNRLESEQHHDGTVTSYSFDLNSNIKSKEISGETSYKFTQDGTDYELTNIPQHNITYAYDKNNRMQSQMEIVTGTGADFGGRVESISSYTYDANGNMLKKETSGQTDERVVEYVYNALNQLTEAKKDGVTVGSYTYDGTGMRRSKTVNGVKTTFYWDRGNIINEAIGSTITADNLFGPDGIISRSESGQVNYYYKDGHGDVYYTHPWDNYNPYLEGTYYDYDAYGNQKTNNTNDTNPFRYCGEYFDDETGLIYLRNRYYDPATSRFISEDPYFKTHTPNNNSVPDINTIMQSSNLYVYAMNNPIRYTDPTGLLSEDEAAQIIKDNSQYIIDAGKEFGVNPGILAACIYAELVKNTSGTEGLEDWTQMMLGMDCSVGVSQVRISTAKKIEDAGYMSVTGELKVYEQWGSFRNEYTVSREERIYNKLSNNQTNIRYAAAYLSLIQDKWESAYPEIDGRTAVLATLYNIGENGTKGPNSNPGTNEFGEFAKSNYYKMRGFLGLD